MTSTCNHDWRNGIKINKKGTLDSVLECENCGRRQYVQEGEVRPAHLQFVPSERYNNLRELFKPKF